MTSKLRNYHAAVWDEPIIMEMGAINRRGFIPPIAEPGIASSTIDERNLVPNSLRREDRLELPELSEFEVLRHYEHLAQQTLGMMGISLFGTCTMKYNPRVNERLAMSPYMSEIHPYQNEATLQGIFEIYSRLDHILQELSGMEKFTFQPGGGAGAAYTHMCMTRAYHASRGELSQRDEIITTLLSHPSNPATAAAAGFKVITLPLEEDGYPSVDALRGAVSSRTAALIMNNPDDIGIYNPHVKEWVDIVHEAGGLCFYDHANFNGVMTRIRAADLGFDACMFMLHKTFGSPKSGSGGPAVGAYGCSEKLRPFLPGPLVEKNENGEFTLFDSEPLSIGRVREFWGNAPVVMRAYSWARAMGSQRIREAADLSVLANNYMEKRLLQIPGISKGFPALTKYRLEMTRYSLGQLTDDTGVSAIDIQNRLTDFGIDAFWLSHEPWFIPEPFTPEAGELWSLEDLDYWIDALAFVCNEAYSNPEIVKTSPHNQVIHRMKGVGLDDPRVWATTWRSYKKKNKEISHAELQ